MTNCQLAFAEAVATAFDRGLTAQPLPRQRQEKGESRMVSDADGSVSNTKHFALERYRQMLEQCYGSKHDITVNRDHTVAIVPKKHEVTNKEPNWSSIPLDDYGFVVLKLVDDNDISKATEVPEAHCTEIQWQMICTARIWCDYFAYIPATNEYGQSRIWANPELQSQLIAAASAAVDHHQQQHEVQQYNTY
eukprot:GEZU01029769.1.p1 GENE.GEZU01029769.1~~GEZU01029769.1.p1  ORF type:complete len:192 (-),score=20.92 GEZU01029769.1:23-598(-)